MPIRELVLLGNPLLLTPSEKVAPDELDAAIEIANDLRDTLHSFRSERRWGRAISAPQIGVLKQITYMEFDAPEIIINPALSEMSSEMIEIWDDCLSFPELLVKVRRHKSCFITYRDRNWDKVSKIIEDAESELLQHEFDHLNGVVATMRAIDGAQFALQSQRDLLGSDEFANAY